MPWWDSLASTTRTSSPDDFEIPMTSPENGLLGWFRSLPVVVKAVAALFTVATGAFTAGLMFASQRFVERTEFEQVQEKLTAVQSQVSRLQLNVDVNATELQSVQSGLSRVEALLRDQSFNLCLLAVELRQEPNADRCFR